MGTTTYGYSWRCQSMTAPGARRHSLTRTAASSICTVGTARTSVIAHLLVQWLPALDRPTRPILLLHVLRYDLVVQALDLDVRPIEMRWQSVSSAWYRATRLALRIHVLQVGLSLLVLRMHPPRTPSASHRSQAGCLLRSRGVIHRPLFPRTP